jgi:predicted permease
VRQLLTESVVLSLVGGGLGLALATGGLSVLKSTMPGDNLLLVEAGIDWQVFAFVTALAVLTGLAFGLAPALSAARLDLVASLKTRGQQSSGIGGTRLRSYLIVCEVTLAVALVISAGLLIKSLWLLNQENPGFQTEQILTVPVYPQKSGDRERAAYVALYNDLTLRAGAITGVKEVAAANTTPLSRDVPLLPVQLEGHPFTPGSGVIPLFWAGAVTPGYFHSLRIPLIAGRFFTEADGEQSSPVVLVSAASAAKFWPGEDPIGKHIRVVWEQQWRTVVGVAGDVRQYDLAGTTPNYINGALYMPYSQSVGLDRRLPTAMTLILRSEGNPQQVGAKLRRLVASVNPDLPVGEVRALDSAVEASTSSSRSLMWLFISFGGCALLLAAIGAYGVVSYSAAQRSYEMGVRLALGATRRSIFGLVLGQSLRLVLTGLGLGLMTSLALTRLMTSFLYGVTATDPLTFVLVSILLVVVALVAGYLPARRAAKVDPMVALRYE